MEKNREQPAQPNGETLDEVRGGRDELTDATGEVPGWITTKVAARHLGVSRRMVQEYVRRGDLKAVVEGKGVTKTYYITIDSLNTLRERRNSKAKDTQSFARVTSANELSEKSREVVGEVLGETLRMVVERLEARTAEAAELRARLELTVQTESTLREALDRERLRAEQERDRADRLEAELRVISEQPPEPRDAPESFADTPGSEQDASQVGSSQEGQEEVRRRRSWLYRFFFGR